MTAIACPTHNVEKVPCPCGNFMCFFRRNNETVCLCCHPPPKQPVEHSPDQNNREERP